MMYTSENADMTEVIRLGLAALTAHPRLVKVQSEFSSLMEMVDNKVSQKTDLEQFLVLQWKYTCCQKCFVDRS
jgi:hypothetical protein